MSYRVLHTASIPAYLQSIPAVAEILGTDAELVIDEIGDGNLNFVYRVSRADDDSAVVILKQAVPYLRMSGEDWPLSRDRMTYEIRALEVYNELVPGLVPTIYHADESMSVLVMEFLCGQTMLRQAMINGTVFPQVGADIGRFLAETLFRTSTMAMGSLQRRALMDKFTMNAELCKLTEEFVFTFPYMEHESNDALPATTEWARTHLRSNSDYKLDVLKFKELFMTQADALLHADLHTGSLMVSENSSFVIDMEFAFFGPFGFDVGKIISNFLLSATSHAHRSGGADYQAWLLGQIRVIWETFESRFVQLWNGAGDSALLMDGLVSPAERAELQRRRMERILKDSVGFAACSMARRTLGIAGVADIRDIEDEAVRSELEITNLKLSLDLMRLHHHVTSIDELIELAADAYAISHTGS